VKRIRIVTFASFRQDGYNNTGKLKGGLIVSGRTITLSEALYQAAARRAAASGQTPDGLVEELLARELLLPHPHIEVVDSPGGPWARIKGTRVGVETIVGYHRVGYTAEEIAQELLRLPLAQVHDALSYYYDNQEVMDADMAQNSVEAWDQQLRQSMSSADYRRLIGQDTPTHG
jgi:uncharacterized protein (DUF433 family)